MEEARTLPLLGDGEQLGLKPLRVFSRSVLVLALHHPTTRPELDHWGGEGDTRGNLSLIRIARTVAQQAESELGIRAVPLDYQPTEHGTFLKEFGGHIPYLAEGRSVCP